MPEFERDDPWTRRVVDAVGCAVVSVDWRPAPENPYPGLMEDCYAGLKWVAAHPRELRIDPLRIAVGGNSSGGGSAAGLALLARDTCEVKISFQILIYPMIDDRNVTPSSHAITDPRLWNRKSNLLSWAYYLGSMAGSENVPPYAAPSRATNVANLPPAFIAVGDRDLFVDEDIEYAQRLIQAGVNTELHVYAGANHGFYRMAPDSVVARRFVRDRDEALRDSFA